jgi:predicted Zn-dependent protease
MEFMENNQFKQECLIFINQMETFLCQNQLPDALTMAEERLSRFPADVDARTFINLVLIEMGRIEESRGILRELEKDITRLSFGYLRAAEAYRDKGFDEDAAWCYRTFLSLNPHADNSGEIAETIAGLQTEECAVEEATESDNPGPEFYTLTLADLYIQQGHTKMAADILKEIIKREPANFQARLKLDAVKDALAQKTSSGDAIASADNLINTLSRWLDNIDRLREHAPNK